MSKTLYNATALAGTGIVHNNAWHLFGGYPQGSLPKSQKYDILAGTWNTGFDIYNNTQGQCQLKVFFIKKYLVYIWG